MFVRLGEQGQGDHWIELASSTNAGRSEKGPSGQVRPSGPADEDSSTHWVPSGRSINLSELTFDLLSRAAVSIRKVTYVTCRGAKRVVRQQQAFVRQRGSMRSI